MTELLLFCNENYHNSSKAIEKTGEIPWTPEESIVHHLLFVRKHRLVHFSCPVEKSKFRAKKRFLRVFLHKKMFFQETWRVQDVESWEHKNYKSPTSAATQGGLSLQGRT